MATIWLEAALNGSWGRRLQPRMPLTVRELIDDGIACADEGAAIVHMHTYDEETGRAHVDAENCARVIDGIREKRDVIVYPTIGGGERIPGSELTVTGPQRYAELERLAANTPELPTPVYRLMLSEGMAFGFPPREYALQAYRWLLREYVPSAPWMLAGYAFDPTPMIPSAVNVGGHVRVGLEDAPFGTERSNVEWVKDAAREIRRCGGELATATQIRASLAQPTN